MKVNETNPNQTAPSELGKARQAAAAAAAHQGKSPEQAQDAEASDRVQISNLSDRLLRMVSSDSPERLARLEKLAAEVRAGRYEVDARALSRSLIEDALVKE